MVCHLWTKFWNLCHSWLWNIHSLLFRRSSHLLFQSSLIMKNFLNVFITLGSNTINKLNKKVRFNKNHYEISSTSIWRICVSIQPPFGPIGGSIRKPYSNYLVSPDESAFLMFANDTSIFSLHSQIIFVGVFG